MKNRKVYLLPIAMLFVCSQGVPSERASAANTAFVTTSMGKADIASSELV